MDLPLLKDFLKEGVKLEDFIKEKDYSLKLQSYLDDERRQASETSKTNTEKKLKKEYELKLEEEVEKQVDEKLANEKLTAEQKVQKELDKIKKEKEKFDADMKEQRINLIKEKVKAKLESAKYKDVNLFTDVEIETHLELVNADEAKSLERIDKLVESRNTYEKEREEKYLSKMQDGTPDIDGDGDSGNESLAVKMAKGFRQEESKDIDW